MSDPIKAVLVDVDGFPRWCTAAERQVATSDGGWYLYAFVDVLNRDNYPPARCKVIREGLVRVECVEVAE